MDSLEATLDELPPSSTKTLLLVGNFNVDILSEDHHQFSSIKDKLGLKQIVSAPTRTTQSSNTLINHVYLSDQLSHSFCSVQPPVQGSDHNSILLTLSNSFPPPRKSIRRKIWMYKDADFDSANATLHCLSSNSFPADDVDSLWHQWYDFFMTTMSQFIPSKVVKQNQTLPYLSNQLKKALKKKLKLFKVAKRSNTEQAWSRYNKVRNRVSSALRAAKSAFFKSLSTKLSSPRDFWSAYYKLSPNKSWFPSDLKHNNQTACSPKAKANLNNFFSSCFTARSSITISAIQSNTAPILSSITCSVDEVQKLLSTHKLRTASGPDGISGQMLRSTADSISATLTRIFNLSLAQMKVPLSWKLAHVTPIPKGGDPSSASNYCPISLLSLVSKILERIIHSRISSFLYSNKLLSNCQFGFRPRSSTQEALLSVMNSWHQLLAKNRQVAAVFFDVKKSF